MLSQLQSKKKSGNFVVAVSGGVDSVVLLHMLSKQNNLELTVAHFDHGIRQDSYKDALFVESLAHAYGANFEVKKGNLGPRASEQLARKHRYEFLAEVMNKQKAKGIFTAHHHDDEIETAIINILRGTGIKGLSPMRANKSILRPLLSFKKEQLIDYALLNKLNWREDPTNKTNDYLRNNIRNNIIPKLNSNPSERKKMSELIRISHKITTRLSKEVGVVFELISSKNRIRRKEFNNLPHKVAAEVLIHWLQLNKIKGLDRKKINNLVIAAKTSKEGAKYPIKAKLFLGVDKGFLTIHFD